MRDLTPNDATLLLQLEQIRYTPQIDRSFQWAWKQFEHGDAPAPAKQNSAEADEAIGYFSTFFETAGVLVRDGLLHEDVFYDRYMVSPFWKLAREASERQRKATGSSAMGENFEWLAAHESEAQARIETRHRQAESSRKSAK